MGLAAISLAWVLFGAAAAEIAAAATPECVPGAVAVRVASVPDPRSVALDDGRVLRVAGIESFSLLHDDAAAADAALRSRLEALFEVSVVRVQPLSRKPDRYGRIPAVVALGAGPTVQEQLAADGLVLAFAAGPEMPCFDRILASEDQARRKGRGFWAGTSLPRARPEALAHRIGRFAIFEGRVVSVGIRRAVTYLNFGGKWSQDVTVEIRGRDRDLFSGEADLAGLSGRRVRVRGFLEERAGPMMTVSSPMQIEVLEKTIQQAGGRP